MQKSLKAQFKSVAYRASKEDCGDGTVLDIRQTPFVDYTFSFIASDAWSIID